MVKITKIIKKFIHNEDKNTFELTISHKNISNVIENNKIKFKKTKISCTLNGLFSINNNDNLLFNSIINFIVVNNLEKVFICNVSINEININDTNNKIIFDNGNNEILIHELIKKIFMNNVCQQENDNFNINFNIPAENIIDDKSLLLCELTSSFKIGIFF